MPGDATRDELGAFLRSCRAQLTPDAVGLPDSGLARRVPGLRREEVAQLASISTDYYTRIEQGRIHATTQVLDSVARALRLDGSQRSYLQGLTGVAPVRPRRRRPQAPRPVLRRLLEQVTDYPALVLGRRMDILAWNALAATMLTDFAQVPPRERNYARLIFCHPEVRAAFADWESIAALCVETLRMHSTRYLDDPDLAALVGELSIQDEHFRRWWADHRVSAATSGVKTLTHPVAGDITVDWELFSPSSDDEQQLLVMSTAPGTPSEEAMRFLAAWSGERHDASAA